MLVRSTLPYPSTWRPGWVAVLGLPSRHGGSTLPSVLSPFAEKTKDDEESTVTSLISD
jgi:hypothetical protein